MVAGVVYLGLLLFVFGLVRGILAICGENVQIMLEEIFAILSEAFSELSVQSVRELPDVWQRILLVISEGTEGFRGQIAALFSGLLTLLVIAFSCAKSVALFYIRNEGKRTGFWKGLLSIAFRTSCSLLFLGVGIWLCTVRLVAVAGVVAVWLLTKSVAHLIVYRLSGQSEYPLRMLFRFRVLWRIQLLYLLNFAITVVLAVVLALALNLLLAVLILLPFAVYLSCCVEANSAAIVSSTLDAPKARKRAGSEDRVSF